MHFRRIALLILFCAGAFGSHAQRRVPDSVLMKNVHYCGLTPAMLAEGETPPPSGGGPQGIVAGAFPPNAIITCGKFDVYYEDMVGSNQMGFNHAQFGAARRATFCAVLNYLESVFNFSNVSPTNRIKIHVDTSYENTLNPAPVGTNFLAYAQPQYPINATGIVNGYMHDYIVNGTYTTNSSGYQVEVRVNFDKTYDVNNIPDDVNFLDDYTQPIGSCNMDLFSTLLHEMGHAMGWFSLVKVNSPGNALWYTNYNNLPVQPNNISYNRFSGLDYGMYAGVPGGTMSRLVNGTTTNPILNTSLTANNNFWTSNSAAPNNHPVFSGLLLRGSHPDIGSYFSHLDEQLGTYSYRYRVSPGDVQPYVMGPYGTDGATTRSFSKGELQTFQSVLGYTFTSSFQSANTTLLTNHPPFSTRMAGYTAGYRDSATIWDIIPANYTINNDGTSNVVINLASATDRSASGISDLDGDPISVMPGTLVNFRGCGDSTANNHNSISVSSNGQIITYTPRKGFYGRAQFGFSLSDGKEQGSFMLYTIEVKRAANVTVPAGNNLVVNGSFEAGTETKRIGTDELIPSSTITRYLFEQKFGVGYMSDGHPYCQTSNPWAPIGSGTIVENANIFCFDATLFKGTAGVGNNAFPNPLNPAGGPNTGQRYQICETTWSPNLVGMYYYLKNDVQQCHKYTLTFDALAGGPAASSIGFLNDITGAVDFGNPTFNYQLQAPFTITPTTGTWQTYSLSFWYCGSAPSNILSIKPNGGGFYIDNIRLVEDTNPAPISVNITQAPGTNCSVQLTANADFGQQICNPSYSWSTGATTATTTVPVLSTAATYTVTVSDGCRAPQTASYTVPAGSTNVTISASQSVCQGVSANLSVSGLLNPVWTPGGSLSCTNCSNPVATPSTSTIYTVSGTDSSGCSLSAQTSVNVTPSPIITVPRNVTVCGGVGTVITASGAAGFTWSPATGLSCTTCPNPTANPTVNTTYTVIGTTNGCTSSTRVDVTVAPLPIVAANANPTQLCTGASSNLTAAGNATSYTWSPATGLNNPNIATPVATPTTTTTYTVTGRNSAGCTDTASVTINVAPCVCAATVFGTGNYTTLTGTITSWPNNASGYYYVNGNLSIGAGMTVVNKVIIVSSGATITVNPGMTLDLSGTHVLTCPGSGDMWKGFAVNGNGATSGRIVVRDNSLIEDAVIAVAVNSPVTPTAGNLLTVNNATFNRNATGVKITTYNATVGTYPFAVTGAVFTCRNFGSYSGYPLSWPSATSLMSTVSNGYQAPYLLPVNYPSASLKSGGDATAGIVLENVGNTVGGTYYGTVIGGANVINLFDNMRCGLETHNSSVTSYNNAFINMKPVVVPNNPLTLGNGIYAEADPAILKAQLQVLSNGTNMANKFYDCVTGMEATGVYNVNASGAFITSSHLYPSTATGAYGIKIKASRYDNLNVTGNSIYNVATGIYYNQVTDQGNYQGNVRFGGNTLDARVPNMTVNNSHYMRQGIMLDNLINCTNCGTVAGTVRISNNIQNVYNGVAVNNFNKQSVSVDHSNIKLILDPSSQSQYGIYISNGPTNGVNQNYVSAVTNNVDNMRAYYATNSPGVRINCNFATDIGRGYEFNGPQPGTIWQANSMENNLKGFVLDGIISAQGSPSGFRSFASSNVWQGTNWNAANQRFQTYTVGTVANPIDPLQSILYVRSGISTNPTVNSNFRNRQPSIYSAGNGLSNSTSQSASINCDPIIQYPINTRTGQSVLISNGVYGPSNKPAQWMGELGVWQSVRTGIEKVPDDADDPKAQSYYDALKDFSDGAANTRFHWITDIEDALSTGNLNVAEELLNSQPAGSDAHEYGAAVITDYTEADYIVDNYAAYYRIYLAYQRGELSDDNLSDLDKLADKCPNVDGAVVFQARSLHRMIFDDQKQWDDDVCNGDAAGKSARNTAGLLKDQRYALSPNPNNGEMVLQQSVADEAPVKAILINAAGQTVYSGNLLFMGNKTNLSAKVIPGLYMLNLTDAQGKTYHLKFIVK